MRKLSTAALLALAVVTFAWQIGGHAQGPADALPYSKGFLVTGNYVVGGVDLTHQQHPAVDGFATGVIDIGNVPANPQTGEPGNVVPAGADIVAAFLYWEAVHPAIISGGVTPVDGVKFRGSPISPTAIKGASFNLAGNLATCWGAAGGSASAVTMFRADVLHLLPKQFDGHNRWTGKYIVNSAELPGSKDLNGNAYGPHTVTLPESTGDLALQSAGATLVVIYRVLDENEPLRKILLFDGVYHKPQGGTMSQTLRGFYLSSGGDGRLTHVVGNGGNNQTEQITFNNGPTLFPANAFPQTSPASDRSWANPTRTVTVPSGTNADLQTAFGQTATTTVTNTNSSPNDCQAWAAVVFSAPVKDVDDDGIPDGVEDAPNGLSDPPTASSPEGNPLPNLFAILGQAGSGKKDVYVEVNAMTAVAGTTYGSSSAPFSATHVSVTDKLGHSHMPSPEVLQMVGLGYSAAPVVNPDTSTGIRVHFDVGDPVAYRSNYAETIANLADPYLITSQTRGGELINEDACSNDPEEDSAESVACQFPDYPGTVGWKIGFQLYRDAPVGDGGEELTIEQIHETWANGQRRRRFDHNRRDFFHYLLYAHARGKPRSDLPCLVPVSGSGDPPVLTPGGFDANDNTSCTTPNPDFHAPRSVSGIADLPGNSVMVTLGLWDIDNFIGSPYVQAATTFHELGHNFNLWHGGLPAMFGNKAATPTPTATYLEPNCKPNYLSLMSYLFQVHGLFDLNGDLVLDYSRSKHTDGTPTDLNENALPGGSLPDGLYRPAWFAPATSPLAGALGVSPATRFCGGARFDPWASRKFISVGEFVRPTVFTGFVYEAIAGGVTHTSEPVWPTTLINTVSDGGVTWKASVVAMARVYGDSPGAVLDWDGGLPAATTVQDVNFDGTPGPLPPTDLLYGFNDWAKVRLDQKGAGRSAVKYSNGDFADFGSGDFVDYGSGDFLDYGSGDFMDFGSGDFADFGSGDFVDFGSGDFMDFGSGDFMDFGSGDFADFGSGDFMDFGSGDFADFGSGDFADFGSGATSQELDLSAATGAGRPAPRQLTACVLGSDGDCSGPQPPPNDPWYHRILLEWKAPTFGHVATYIIERMRTDISGQPWVQIVPSTSVPTLTALSFIDEELPHGKQFKYRVRGQFDDDVPGVGPWSNESAIKTAINNAPMAMNDTGYTTLRNTSFGLAAPGVLTNDADVDSPTPTGPSTFAFRARRAVLVGPGTVVTAPDGLSTTTAAGGTIVLRFDGSFTYKPKNGFTGSDTFTYQSNSGLWIRDSSVPLSDFSSTVTVTINVVTK